MNRSEILVAAFASALTLFIALAFLRPAGAQNATALPGGIGVLVHSDGGYAGSMACASCHAREFAAWGQSHHAHAMADANAETVLGNFNDIGAVQGGSQARFFRRDGHFMVETENRKGEPQSFTIVWTFGITPLQQYLIRFDDGRVQVLPWAWDTRPAAEGGQRWFHVYGEEAIPPSDTRHWTRGQQNWNYMCAECHSTHVEKNYDTILDRFNTTYSEISVGCEACHGPGASHIAWVRDGQAKTPLKGFAHKAAQRGAVDWSIDPRTGSPTKRVARPEGDEVETCARCHARRTTISEDWRPGVPAAQTHRPALLSDGLFEADGIMRDEVFNDQTFKQSLMYDKGVVCSDCHDPHSARLKAEGAQVCGQCHDAVRFSSVQHTGHAGKTAPDCIGCHMPARTYMVVDKRHDHSFRIPRPDLSVRTGGPNACNDCHTQQSAQWAADAIVAWHGTTRRGFQTWGEPFATARKGDPAARTLLLATISNTALPALVRATALEEAVRFPSRDVAHAASIALKDPSPIVRLAALRPLAALPVADRLPLLLQLLRDPIRIVRIDAAIELANLDPHLIPPGEALAFERALGEAEAALILNADRPEARARLAQLSMQKGQMAEAERALRAALAQMSDAAALAVNLADLYRATGREADASAVLTEFLTQNPDAMAVRHALGLSLVRQKKYAEAIALFQQAHTAEPENARYAYVYGVALQSAGETEKGRAVLEAAEARDPWNLDLNNALLADALRSNDVPRAAIYAARLTQLRPDDASLARLSNVLNRK